MRRYFIAEVVECNLDELGYGTWLNERCLTLRCPGCRGDGTRTVVTDIEVTPDTATSGDTVIRVWLEDPR